MKTQLLCTFTKRNRLYDTIGLIIECHDIVFSKIYVFANEDDHHHHLVFCECTTVVEIGECFSEIFEQRIALEQVDGLFIQPLVGRKKKGDYTPQAILRGYRTLIGEFYPADKVALGILSTYMRYAGPREAVFHALVRRNYGCTHFIIGRDHAGVGDYYGTYEAHEMTRRFDGDLGIEIMYLHGPYFCGRCDGIVTEQTCPHEKDLPDSVTHISGTDMRAMLLGGKEPDAHLMRPEVIAALQGTELFIEDDET